jgi:B12-binding domain/radical SAM domain protein
MALRAVAVAAPELPEGGPGVFTLKSSDPASLFNACRVAARQAVQGTGPWSDTPWAQSRKDRRDRVLLMHSLADDMPAFEALLGREQPNLLLIGAMSVCLPGAVACAVRAKELLGDDVCVVLGGRHPSETMYADEKTGKVSHHVSSPVRLMAEGLVPRVFDLVIGGEGEEVICRLGEAVAEQVRAGRSPSDAAAIAARVQGAAGRWVAGWYDGDGPCVVVGNGAPLHRESLPTPAESFGVTARFDVFGGRLTGHVFSDTGNGCVFDCDFCSERRSVTGGLFEAGTAAGRLVRQLRAVAEVVAADWPGQGAAAFVEDSTLVGGSPRQLADLTRLLGEADLPMRFGCQFTIDQILSRGDLIEDLHAVGLDYVFIGVETLEPLQIGGMDKDQRSRNGSWSSRSQRAIDRLAGIGVQAGAAVLFGLGETQERRLALLRQLAEWRLEYGSPSPISLNWATQHPLRGADHGTGYRYTDWSVPPGAWAEAFADFGEATAVYPIRGAQPARLEEVEEVVRLYKELV